MSLDKAIARFEEAREAAHLALQKEFPIGQYVIYERNGYQFSGTVAQHPCTWCDPTDMRVTNERTGKTRRVYVKLDRIQAR